jgi:hypothetical protein
MSSCARVDWCSHAAAAYAVERWHYTRSMPGGKRAQLGVWEDGRFVGALVYGSGATPMLHRPFALGPDEVCELVRVALGPHTTPVSRVLAVATRLLRQAMPGLRLVVSFADTAQGHHGGIYQAAGWAYLGPVTHHTYIVGGQAVHPRTLYSRLGPGGQSVTWLRAHLDPQARRVRTPPKHKYALTLDPSLRPLLEQMRRPYPPRAGGVAASTGGHRPPGGGATPTPALQPKPPRKEL